MIYKADKDHDYISQVFNGQKTIDIKLFGRKVEPWKKLAIGDNVYIKERSKNIVGYIKIAKVTYIELLGSEEEIISILEPIWDRIDYKGIKNLYKYANKKIGNRYLTIIEWSTFVKLDIPVKFDKRDRRSFVSNIPSII